MMVRRDETNGGEPKTRFHCSMYTHEVRSVSLNFFPLSDLLTSDADWRIQVPETRTQFTKLWLRFYFPFSFSLFRFIEL